MASAAMNSLMWKTFQSTEARLRSHMYVNNCLVLVPQESSCGGSRLYRSGDSRSLA